MSLNQQVGFPTWSIDRFKNFATALKLSTRVWKEFHNSSSKDKGSFQFTFPEFVRLVVNGTKKFAADEYMSQVAQVLSIIRKKTCSAASPDLLALGGLPQGSSKFL